MFLMMTVSVCIAGPINVINGPITLTRLVRGCGDGRRVVRYHGPSCRPSMSKRIFSLILNKHQIKCSTMNL